MFVNNEGPDTANGLISTSNTQESFNLFKQWKLILVFDGSIIFNFQAITCSFEPRERNIGFLRLSLLPEEPIVTESQRRSAAKFEIDWIKNWKHRRKLKLMANLK